MSVINFPNSPEINDPYSFGDQDWIWNGFAWDLVPNNGNNAFNCFWLDNDGDIWYPNTVSVGTTSKTEEFNVDGNINLSERVVYGTKEIVGEDFIPGQSTALFFDELSAFDFRSIEFTIQVEARGGKVQISKIMATHNFIDAFYNEYGGIYTNGKLINLSVSMGFNTINLEADVIAAGIEKVIIEYKAIRIFQTSSVTSSFVGTWKNCTNLTSIDVSPIV
jgi:hypothetical protein